MRKYGDKKSGVDIITWAELKAKHVRNPGVLSSELEHRDPTDDLTNVDDGKAISAVDMLPHTHRQLLQEGNINVQLSEVAGRYRLTKLVKKREAAYLQGTDKYFVTDKFGARIPVSEEVFDILIGIEKNPDDVYEAGEVISIEKDHTPPMDRWDLTAGSLRSAFEV